MVENDTFFFFSKSLYIKEWAIGAFFIGYTELGDERMILTGHGSRKSDDVLQQPQSELVAANAWGTHEDQRPALISLGVIQGHLLVRRDLEFVS